MKVRMMNLTMKMLYSQTNIYKLIHFLKNKKLFYFR